MGADLEGIAEPVAARVEHPPLQHHVPEPPHHPALAAEFALHRRRHPLLGKGAGLVDRAPAPLGQLEGKGDVLTPARVELEVGLAADRVDRPVARGHPGEAGLEPAHGHLVAPVEALLVSALAAEEADLAADVADPLVGEAVEQPAERIGPPEGVGVGEGEDLALGLPDGGVQRRHLAAPGQLQHPVGAGRAGQLRGAVGGAVGGDDQLQALPRVVELERVGDPPLDHRLLVVGGHDQRHPRQLAGATPTPTRPRRTASPAPRGGADSRGGRRRSGRRRPEDDLERHSRGLSGQKPLVEGDGLAADLVPGVACRGPPPGRPRRAARARRDRRAGSCSTRASASGFPGGASVAAPSSATSGKPPTAESTRGRPKASAV